MVERSIKFPTKFAHIAEEIDKDNKENPGVFLRGDLCWEDINSMYDRSKAVSNDRLSTKKERKLARQLGQALEYIICNAYAIYKDQAK